MRVSCDVYTKDVDAALAAYKTAIKQGATDVRLNSSENYDTKEFEYLNLMFDCENTASIFKELDDRPFDKDSDNL